MELEEEDDVEDMVATGPDEVSEVGTEDEIVATAVE